MPQLKQLARQIFHETLASIDIPAAMQRKLQRKGTVLLCGGTKVDLRHFEKLRVVAIGKAAHAMVEGLTLVLAPFLRIEGVVSAPTAARRPLAGMKYFVSGHPVPNADSWRAAEAILALLKRCDEKTLVFFLLSGSDDLFHPAHHAAEAKGFVACCDNTSDDWPVEEAAAFLLEQLEALRKTHAGQRVALIADGEVSSPVKGDGVGGRNSAFVLACVERIAGKKIAVLSVGTDGIDGNSPAAGAVADGETLARAQAVGLDPADAFRRSDAFTFFSALDDAIVSGPMGNHLRDLRILLAEP